MRYLIKTSTTLREGRRNCAERVDCCILEDSRTPLLGSLRTTPPDCPAAPTQPSCFKKGQMIRTLALRYPQESQGWSQGGPKAAPAKSQLSRGTQGADCACRALTAPHPLQRMLWVPHPLLQASPLILPSPKPVLNTCLEYIYITLHFFFLIIIKHLVLGH